MKGGQTMDLYTLLLLILGASTLASGLLRIVDAIERPRRGKHK